MRNPTLVLLMALSISSSHALAQSATDANPGVLDRPLPESPTQLAEVIPQPAAVLNAETPEEIEQALTEILIEELEELEQLPRGELEERAEQGERAAQVTLAEDFAEEASLLAFAPEAANDALSDAVRWYTIAAQRGYPGAPSLEQAGVQFYPIRVQRSRNNT